MRRNSFSFISIVQPHIWEIAIAKNIKRADKIPRIIPKAIPDLIMLPRYFVRLAMSVFGVNRKLSNDTINRAIAVQGTPNKTVKKTNPYMVVKPFLLVNGNINRPCTIHVCDRTGVIYGAFGIRGDR